MNLDGSKAAVFILSTTGLTFLACATTTSGPETQNVTFSPDPTTRVSERSNTTQPLTAPPATSAVTSTQVGVTSLSAQRERCFQQANLTQAFTNFTCDTGLLVHYSLMEFWTHHASPHMCQKREVYGEVMSCLLDATRSCLPHRNRVHFPNKTKAMEGVHYICGVSEVKQFDVNMTCAQIHFPKVFNCIYEDILLVMRRDSLDSHIHPSLVCRTYDIADLCCWEQLQVCGTNTAAAYTRLMSLYLRPPSCPSAAAMTSPASLLAFVFVVSSWILM